MSQVTVMKAVTYNSVTFVTKVIIREKRRRPGVATLAGEYHLEKRPGKAPGRVRKASAYSAA
ncbi:hypothetical protein DYD83_06450 [Dickeya fangzhongdai]|uniref:Uncharacterized protein n=1 Tax=Dickeya fangzhongdai TaxID=1778540 RepID=A0A2K8QKQ2_9GAMM|nr:hypothetical protein CVE23_06405 [Dickeya fangzhongdai]QOH47079.1 hypothetical protein DYD82_06450 [Dickeya fangzhongdai]QOH51384.1 hypothetical protein DYD83_06450 [Dickeya fangzhongdai]GGC09458.1 hypothetical protein GCM10007171_28210 [Dickeya fangzhongdai]